MPLQNRIKQEILSRSIEEDQHAVAVQWCNTFIANGENDVGTNIAKLLVSLIAGADFKTRSEESQEFTAPNKIFNVVDYLSHASRIIIDYQDLDETNRKALLEYFSKMDPRTSTHAVKRGQHGIKELKGTLLGAQGFYNSATQNPTNFGVNIPMGGIGQLNFIGEKISNDGHSGHFLCHRNDAHHLLLTGLEQNSTDLHLPLLQWAAPDSPTRYSDQFGQTHSLLGSSDTYTAAGSLYFSDPVYQAKLLNEKDIRSPLKYGGMLVTLNNENWVRVNHFLDELNACCTQERQEHLLGQLKKAPGTSSCSIDPKIEAYISLDFTAYLKRIYEVFIPDGDASVLRMHRGLGELINAMQGCDAEENRYALLNENLSDMIGELITYANAHLNDKAISRHYITAIGRIQTLFEKQFERSRGLSEAQQNLLIEQQIEQLAEIMQQRVHQASCTKAYFEIHHHDPEYTHRLSEIISACKQIDCVSSDEEDNEYTDIRTDSMGELKRYTDLIEELERILSENPDHNVRAQLLTTQAELITANQTLEALDEIRTQKNEMERHHESLAAQLTAALTQTQYECETAQTLLARTQAERLAANQALDEIRAQQNEMERQHANLAAQLNQATLPLDGLSLQIIGAAAFILGAAAVALALTALVMGTAGAGALVMGASGVVSCCSGAFFFYQGTRLNQPIVPEPVQRGALNV